MPSSARRVRRIALTLVLGLALPLAYGLGGAAGQDDHHPPAGAKHDAGHAKADDHGGHDATGHDATGHDDRAAHHEPTAIEHVSDADEIELFHSFGKPIHLPEIFGFQITKFMVLEVIAALLIIAIYVPIAQRMRSGEPARGAWANAFEVLLTFVRDQIAKPSIGEDKADRYVPFLWTMFLFILFNNLLGMFPFLGSATASIYVTGALALIVFFAIHGSAILAMGRADYGHGHGHDDHGHGDHGHDHHGHEPHGAPAQGVHVGFARYIASIWPQIDVPIPVVGLLIKLLVFVIEIVGILVRNAVLAVRLFANMFAGHMVLATILLFITMAANLHPALWGTITLSSVLGIVALSLLELFVAFLQAYIFTFLTALFMGMAITPQH